MKGISAPHGQGGHEPYIGSRYTPETKQIASTPKNWGPEVPQLSVVQKWTLIRSRRRLPKARSSGRMFSIFMTFLMLHTSGELAGFK
jgi:hypothetical protein